MISRRLENWKRPFLNAFIATHLAILFFWGLPTNRFAIAVTTPVRSYVMFAGLWHTWSMFAPSPYKENRDMRARVEFKDGSTEEWIWPHVNEMPAWKQMPKERYRKWREQMYNEAVASAWFSSAKFVARQMNVNWTNPPVKVTLTRFWSPVPPPNLKEDYQPLPKDFTPTKSYVIGTYRIAAKDLE